MSAERWFMDGRVDGDGAVSFYADGERLMECIERAEGMEVRIGANSVLKFMLDAEQTHRLGRFCVNQFMTDADELLQRMRVGIKLPIASLEAWNARARIDEEHPPYETLVASLEQLTRIIDELEQGLKAS